MKKRPKARLRSLNGARHLLPLPRHRHVYRRLIDAGKIPYQASFKESVLGRRYLLDNFQEHAVEDNTQYTPYYSSVFSISAVVR